MYIYIHTYTVTLQLHPTIHAFDIHTYIHTCMHTYIHTSAVSAGHAKLNTLIMAWVRSSRCIPVADGDVTLRDVGVQTRNTQDGGAHCRGRRRNQQTRRDAAVPMVNSQTDQVTKKLHGRVKDATGGCAQGTGKSRAERK